MAGYNEGDTFFADARSPLRGGLAGNTVGGDAFIQVKKRYHKDSDVSALRFTYSSALLEVMDFGSGAPPWKAPYAEITMEVDVFQDGVGYVWGLSQTALARSVSPESGKEVRTEAETLQVDRPKAKIGEGIHDAAQGRLIPLGMGEPAGQSVRTTNLVGG